MIKSDTFNRVYLDSPDATLLMSPDGTVIAANPVAYQLLRQTEVEICNADYAGLLDTDSFQSSDFFEAGKCGQLALEQILSGQKVAEQVQEILNAANRFAVDYRLNLGCKVTQVQNSENYTSRYKSRASMSTVGHASKLT